METKNENFYFIRIFLIVKNVNKCKGLIEFFLKDDSSIPDYLNVMFKKKNETTLHFQKFSNLESNKKICINFDLDILPNEIEHINIDFNNYGDVLIDKINIVIEGNQIETNYIVHKNGKVI